MKVRAVESCNGHDAHVQYKCGTCRGWWFEPPYYLVKHEQDDDAAVQDKSLADYKKAVSKALSDWVERLQGLAHFAESGESGYEHPIAWYLWRLCEDMMDGEEAGARRVPPPKPKPDPSNSTEVF